MSLSSLPLLSQQTVEQTELSLISLARASAALKAGKLPTSEQLARYVQALLKSDVLQPEVGSRFGGAVGGGKLSGPGKEVVKRGREVLEAILRVVMEKNDDDKFQRFIYAASQASVDIEGQLETPDIPLPTAEELAEARDSLKQLLTLLLTSNQLRSLLTDSVNLFRDLFADAAESVAQASIETTKASKKAAKAARPSEGEREGGDVKWDIEELPEAKEVKKKAYRSAEDAKDDAQRALRRKRKQLKEYVDEKLPTDAKDAAIERFKQIINEIQSDPQYEDAVTTLFSLVRKYAALAKSAVVEAASTSTAEASANKPAGTAASLFREIIESFTGPLDDVLRATDAVIKDLQNDSRIEALFDKANELIDRAIYEEGYATSSKAQRKAEKIYDEAKEIIQSNAAWKKDVDALVKALNAASDRAAKDRALQNLGDKVDRFEGALKKFGKKGVGLVNVDGGAIWNDLTQVFVPRILNALKSIPLPRVEYTSAEFDLAIDNLSFTSPSFLPDATHFTNHLELSTTKGYAAYVSNLTTSTTLSISGLRLQARDISYYVNKKSGWIGIEDYGLLDIDIGTQREGADDGLDVSITIENADEEDRESFFKVNKVEVAVEGFAIRIHDSQHPFRNWLARPALRSYLESSFISVLEEQIGEMFRGADSTFYALQQRAIGAGRAAPDPMTYLRAIFTPTASGDIEVGAKGITKVGKQGEYVLAIGVEEELLKGKKTGLGIQGKDVVGRKRAVEGLMEEGRAAVEEGRERVEEAVEEVAERGERVEEEFGEAQREEQRRWGWRSDAFDL